MKTKNLFSMLALAAGTLVFSGNASAQGGVQLPVYMNTNYTF